MPLAQPLARPLYRTVKRSLIGSTPTSSYAGHNMVAFDGTNDYLSRAAAYAGLSAVTRGTIAFKYKPAALGGSSRYVIGMSDGVSAIGVSVSGAGYVTCEMYSPDGGFEGFYGGTPISTTSPAALAIGVASTVHIAFSTAGSGVMRCWVNGTETPESGMAADATGAIHLAGFTSWSVGALPNGSNKISGSLGFMWAAFGTTDASYITDPTKFYSGGDVDLGTNGTGSGLTQPLIFWGGRNTAADWNGTVGTQTAQNKGSAADLWTMASDGVV